MKVGIIGTGFMGAAHAAGWAEIPVEIAGFVMSQNKSDNPLPKKYGTKTYYAIEEILPEVDVIDICTPTFLHLEQVRIAAEAGKDIVCEKPLALDLKSALEIERLCRLNGVRLFVAHVVRYFPEYAKACELVRKGDFGTPATVHLRRCSYRPKKPVGNWFLNEKKSGGILMDLAIHDFDYARWVSGEVKTVFAAKVSSFEPAAQIDYGLVILTHEKGTLSHVTCGWAYPPPNFQTGFDINCENGNIHFDSAETAPINPLIHRNEDSSDVALPGSPMAESPYTAEIRDFYQALMTGTDARVHPLDGVKAVQIACAAQESARTGEPVQLADLEGGLK